jgi:hypothetical protein
LACRATSSSSGLPSLAAQQEEQQREQQATWLPRLAATAGLCAAAFCLSARPAHAAAATSSSSPPPGTLPAHAASADASASYAAAAAAAQQPAWQHAAAEQQQQQQRQQGWRDTGILLASKGDEKVGCDGPRCVQPARRVLQQWGAGGSAGGSRGCLLHAPEAALARTGRTLTPTKTQQSKNLAHPPTHPPTIAPCLLCRSRAAAPQVTLLSPEELAQQGNSALNRLLEDQGLSPKEMRAVKRMQREPPLTLPLPPPQLLALARLGGSRAGRLLRCVRLCSWPGACPCMASPLWQPCAADSHCQASAGQRWAARLPAPLPAFPSLSPRYPIHLSSPPPPCCPPLPPAVPSKGGRKVDPSKSLVPDPSKVPSAKEFEASDNFGLVTIWCAAWAGGGLWLSGQGGRICGGGGLADHLQLMLCGMTDFPEGPPAHAHAHPTLPSRHPCPPRFRRPDRLKDMTYTQFWNLVRERKVEKVRCRQRYCHKRDQRCCRLVLDCWKAAARSLRPAALPRWETRCPPRLLPLRV